MIISTCVCRYGKAYALHRLPAVTSIMLTQEYLEFAQRVKSSHDKADKQAELDVSASMGEMLQDMQACLKQLCGSSAVGDPEVVARLIAQNISAMNINPDGGSPAEDLGEVPALPAPAAKQDVILPDRPALAKSLKASLIRAPVLYDTSGSINTVLLAWQEWNSGPAQTTLAQRVLEIKAHKHMSMGRRNVHLHKKNRHLPQLIESLISTGASPVQAVNLLTHIADHFHLTLDHLREGARLLSGKTAKGNNDRLTAETTMTLGQFKAALGWAYAQVNGEQHSPKVNEANICYQEAVAAVAHK
jgi:hypothetical protein